MKDKVGDRPDDVEQQYPPKIIVRYGEIVRENIDEVLQSDKSWSELAGCGIEYVESQIPDPVIGEGHPYLICLRKECDDQHQQASGGDIRPSCA